MTVYNESEWNKIWKKDKRRAMLFSEQYAVKYWIKEGEFTTQKEALYYGTTKNKHNEVEKRFKKDFPTAKIISVCYE